MKTLLTFLIPLLFPVFLSGQQFQWAMSYDIESANEVSALATDADSNLIAAGIYNAPITLPFKGNAFLVKTEKSGNVIWEDSISGQVIIGDMATVGNKILIVGQSWNNYTYRGEPYGEGQYFMFAMMLDGDGNHLWHYTDEDRWGAEANISVGNNGLIALHVRGAGNARDWIKIIDQDGNEIKGRQISPSFNLVSDIVYYDDKLYFNGGFNGPGTVTIDTILVELPPTQNAAITMCFNEDLVAEWLFVDETFNNNAGQIVANENGLYIYEPVVVDGFTSRNSLKLISFDGQLIKDVDPPLFSPFAVFRVSMVATPSHIALFTRNANNNTSHILLVYDHDLNLEASKVIGGGAQYYVPGHLAANGDDLFVTQVHNTNMVFDATLELPFSGTSQNFYIAEFSSSTVTGFSDINIDDSNIRIYPNPASDFLIINDASGSNGNTFVEISNVSGKQIQRRFLKEGENRIDLNGIASGLYLVKLYLEENPNKPVIRKLMVK
jgi:hypothetical protein